MAVQYHPEYLTRPLEPSAPYLGLILAAKNRLTTYLNNGCRFSSPTFLNGECDEDCLEQLSDLHLGSNGSTSSLNGHAWSRPSPVLNHQTDCAVFITAPLRVYCLCINCACLKTVKTFECFIVSTNIEVQKHDLCTKEVHAVLFVERKDTIPPLRLLESRLIEIGRLALIVLGEVHVSRHAVHGSLL